MYLWSSCLSWSLHLCAPLVLCILNRSTKPMTSRKGYIRRDQKWMLLASAISFLLATFRQVASITYMGIYLHSIFFEYQDISVAPQLSSRSLRICKIIVNCGDTFEVDAIWFVREYQTGWHMAFAHSLFWAMQSSSGGHLLYSKVDVSWAFWHHSCY